MALSQAKTSAAMIAPINTAKAKFSRQTVTKVSQSMTKISDLGYWFKVLKLAYPTIPIATMNINHVNAAMGTCPIKLLPNITKTNNINAATMPDNLALAPFDMLIKL